MRRILKQATLSLALLLSLPAAAQLRVVASTSDMGLLAAEIGGERVSLEVLAPADRDPHYLVARPGMMRALRGADLLIHTGAGLEQGWLPAAMDGAANPAIREGRAGNFNASAQVSLRDVGVAADRALGDVHPEGNPHFSLDPLRYARVAEALAARLATLDAQGAEYYLARAEAFKQALAQRLPRWREALQGAPGAVLYHKNADYLLARFEVPLLGLLEPVPGVPPTGRHLRELIDALRGRDGVVLYHGYQSPAAPQRLARALGWDAREVPAYPPADEGAQAYFRLIDQWVRALGSTE
ncbi:metal ABC transporter substrate-binding protein [Alkalilimnicola sp. S0819]|uniref:metal ABC transporter substrate-binding protein n=1 Tax=Alkalilimnicola sp. S0819 TaxID=2613922 RepID=UPI0012629C57|nr:metal ABC transporter substrate-binding protein [Alkalilimnicola sp. S0819]KAB7627222.1 zinc ABC transporter substrate-binding protein [Alkalilimnicola sp. S0819]MPQ15935.1 zinc ABC transporter substrate-binding protein [Alkalilimnicola sp. S0819]